jgi:hypothetical protein
MHRCAPDRDRDAIGVGSSLEGRIKMISTSDHAFESAHATPLEAGRILADTLVNAVTAT